MSLTSFTNWYTDPSKCKTNSVFAAYVINTYLNRYSGLDIRRPIIRVIFSDIETLRTAILPDIIQQKCNTFLLKSNTDDFHKPFPTRTRDNNEIEPLVRPKDKRKIILMINANVCKYNLFTDRTVMRYYIIVVYTILAVWSNNMGLHVRSRFLIQIRHVSVVQLILVYNTKYIHTYVLYI